MADKYTAYWISYTSIKDFTNCPRSYYLKNIYKDPDSGHKIKIISPPLSLGQAVHDVIEQLANIKKEERFTISYSDRLEKAWKKVTGKKGGFMTSKQEETYYSKAKKMLERLWKNPGPLKNLAVRLTADLPYYWLSEKDEIILCGKIDWLEYFEDRDSLHIIDFKTSKTDEKEDSLQLPIYCLIVSNCQSRPIAKASYWYIERNTKPTSLTLPDLKRSHDMILDLAKEIVLARKLNRFPCKFKTGCNFCRSYESILQKRAEYVGVDNYNADLYIIGNTTKEKENVQIL